MTYDDLRVEDVRTFEELDKYSDEWNLLALNASQEHPVLTHAWISAYLKTSLNEGETWFCLFVFDNNAMVGVLPLLSRESRFLGKKYLLLSTPCHNHTRWVDFLFREEYAKRVIQLIAEYLNAMRPQVVRLILDQVLCNSPTFDALEDGVHGMYSCRYVNNCASIIYTKGGYSDFKKKLSKSMIRNLRRFHNKFKKLGNYSVNVINSSSDAREDLLSFANIEQSGWKGKKGTAISYQDWKFYDEFTQNMGKKGWLEYYFLETENRKIAGYLTIPFGRSVIVFKTGYDEKYHYVSPGSILTEKMIEHMFSTGKYENINFLTDYKWHSRWNMELKPYYKIVFAFNNPLSFFLTRLPYIIYSKFTPVRRIRTSIFRAIQIVSGKK